MNDLYRSGPEIEPAPAGAEEVNKIKKLFQSRKFWALLAAIVAIAAGFSTGQITSWEALQLLIAALAAYSTGIALVDAGAAAGAAGVAGTKEGPNNGG